MSEIITSENIDLVINRNKDISEEVHAQVLKLQTNPFFMKTVSIPQLAILTLQDYGLIQFPIEDKYWSGAIFVKDGKMIPVINTALPRANQYFAAWHELYHVLFDNVSFDHVIENEITIEERKAEYFAACMLLQGLGSYYKELPSMDFVPKVLHCMAAFQVPFKAVLVALYEDAAKSDNEKMKKKVKDVLDVKIDDLPGEFRNLGLDDSLVRPSYVINTSYLQNRISQKITKNPDLNYHKDNADFLNNTIREIQLITGNNK